MDAFTDFQAGRLGSIPAHAFPHPNHPVPHGAVRARLDQTPSA